MRKRHTDSEITRAQGGFSAVEMMVALILILAVVGVVVKGMTDLQRRNFSEMAKMDAVQDARDFIDQMVRDVHDVGYPPPRAIGWVNGAANNNPYCTDALMNGNPNLPMLNNPNIACGIVQFSSTQVVYEADLDGLGTVSRVYLQLQPGVGNTCPCILQRGVVTKAQWVANNAIIPQYFTTVNGVLNSGNGAGGATFPIVLGGPGNYVAYGTSDVFAAYDALANQIVAPCTMATNPDCSQIRSLRITINVAPNYADPTSKQFPVFSITSRARVNY